MPPTNPYWASERLLLPVLRHPLAYEVRPDDNAEGPNPWTVWAFGVVIDFAAFHHAIAHSRAFLLCPQRIASAAHEMACLCFTVFGDIQMQWIRFALFVSALEFLTCHTPIAGIVGEFRATDGIEHVMATIAKQMEEYMLLGPMVRFLIQLMPYVIMSAVFIGLYIFMPNTKVRLKDAILPGILAGVAMQLLQYFYIHCQIFLSGYNAIYGSFAALPLFMLWVQLSWIICLFGAELTYTSQNLEEFAFLARTEELSHRNYMLISALIMNKICVRFKEGKKPYTAYKLKKDTGIPIRIIKEILHELVQVRILSVTSMDKNQDVTYQPYTSLDHLTVGMLFDKLEANGKWTIDIDLRKLELRGGWKNILMARHDYFKTLKDIPLTDL